MRCWRDCVFGLGGASAEVGVRARYLGGGGLGKRLTGGDARPVAAVGDGDVDGTTAFGEADIGDAKIQSQGGHGRGPDEVVQGLTG